MKSKNQLGPQLAVYRNLAWASRLLFMLVLPGTLFVLAPLAYGIYRANFDYSHFGPAAVERWKSTWIIFTLAASFLFLLILFYWPSHNLRSVALHENGLSLALTRHLALPWDQIAGISSEITSENFFGIPIRSRQSSILYRAHGKNIRLDGLDNLPDLVGQIKNHLYPRVFPALEVGFQTGQWLQFGNVAIQADALRLGGRQVPWSQVGSLSIESGDLVVEFKNQVVHRQPIGAIPNLELLLKIVQRISV